eukprot:g1969.t1
MWPRIFQIPEVVVNPPTPKPRREEKSPFPSPLLAALVGMAFGASMQYFLSSKKGKSFRSSVSHALLGLRRHSLLSKKITEIPADYKANVMPLEICVDSLESAVTAEISGAARVELCAGLPEGGTTPSGGMIRAVCQRLTIPVMVLIRPRVGDFLYSTDEVRVMVENIKIAKANGASGVVIGALMEDGSIDERITALLTSAARPMSVTFSRAIDVSKDPVSEVRILARLGVDRVLSSGGAATALEGADQLAAMVAAAREAQAEAIADHMYGGRRILEVVAGAGVNGGNIAEIVKRSGVASVHGSFRDLIQSRMKWKRQGLPPLHMGGGLVNKSTDDEHTEYSWKVASEKKIVEAVEVLTDIAKQTGRLKERQKFESGGSSSWVDLSCVKS